MDKAASDDASSERVGARNRGRPRGESAGNGQAVGRDALIDTTIKLLRTIEPKDITPMAVARATSVHPSLMRYYFGTRAGLLVAVAERMMSKVAARVEKAAGTSNGSPRDRLLARIAAIIELNDSFPNFHQLMVSEIAGSKDPLAQALIAQATRSGTSAYSEILAEGVEDGSFREVDPSMLYAAVIGMAEFLPAVRRQLELAYGRTESKQQLRETYTNFVCELVLGGLAVRPANREATPGTERANGCGNAN
ncbi:MULTISPECIES: hypothetical protein [unclassified Sphingomonas]|uniref:hypothetical protein n=1 Tax=unclassified Sphingomonas TaxID=196159 RepID=UPI00226A30E7|nr:MULTISPECIES: hypothetical protein [unclassified Sphingomonas]